MKRLSKRQILMMHTELVACYGGEDGVLDEGMLDSAVHAPFQTFGGEELYPTVLEKAARLGYGLIQNHAFVDGNKRIGVHSMLVLLLINGVRVEYQDRELIEVGLSVAAGSMSYADLLEWLREHLAGA